MATKRDLSAREILRRDQERREQQQMPHWSYPDKKMPLSVANLAYSTTSAKPHRLDLEGCGYESNYFDGTLHVCNVRFEWGVYAFVSNVNRYLREGGCLSEIDLNCPILLIRGLQYWDAIILYPLKSFVRLDVPVHLGGPCGLRQMARDGNCTSLMQYTASVNP